MRIELWEDIQMYDALESDLHDNGKNGVRFAEAECFANAVCLSPRGKIQAGKYACKKVVSTPFPKKTKD